MDNNKIDLAPIVLFVYNRPWHTEQTLKALSVNELADQSTLYIYSDGLKNNSNPENTKQVNEVRALIKSKKWCKEIIIIERDKNWGLADNIVDGITSVVNKHDKVIVLEDDIVTTVGFLKYMNTALDVYLNDKSVMSISGLSRNFETNKNTYFLPFPNSHGWGTWKDSWKHYNNDISFLFETITLNGDQERFSLNNHLTSYRQLRENYEGKLKTWGVKWYASFFLQNGIALYPKLSLVKNIGYDNTGENCRLEDQATYEIVDEIDVQRIEPKVESEIINIINQPKVIKRSLAKKVIKNRFTIKALSAYQEIFGNNGYLALRKQDLERNKKQLPKVLNLNANDICNSKCTMCNIWEQKQEHELTPEELRKILSDPLYSKINHVGITGGEPTLRDDLADLYEAAIVTIPALKGVSIITNAIQEKQVIQRIEEVIAVCNKHNTPFSIMVSLDGYGEMHDKIRGREGNFKTAINVIKHFKSNSNIPVSIGCTISKENLWYVDDLLDFLIEENIYGRFRIAEFIERLYNSDKKQIIRNYTEDELYHLQLFFKKLELTYEKKDTYKRTYRNIHKMLQGEKRSIGCPYQSEGVNLNSKGGIAYCAPKSKIIGSALLHSSQEIFDNNLDYRAQIISDKCGDCIHDYHVPKSAKEKSDEIKAKLFNSLKETKNLNKSLLYSKFLKKPKNIAKDKLNIFIVGWYGTETVGDKAILAGIISYYIETLKSKKIEFIIGSLYPFITKKTVKELKINATIIDSSSKQLLTYSKYSDIIVMGGGPLMDINELYVPLMAFNTARSNKKKTVVFGCGIGPLRRKHSVEITKKILALSDEILLRDEKSVAIAKEWTNRTDITCINDPAKSYLLALSNKLGRPNVLKNQLSCFLRNWTIKYANTNNNDVYLIKKKKFEKELATKIIKIAKENNVEKIYFNHMHNFTIGEDDRDFSRRFIKEHFSNNQLEGVSIEFERKLSTIETVIETMQSSKINLCMRFHSVVFAHTLDTNFKAIDYTLGGKILNYLTDNNALDRLTEFDSLKS
jgi:MoaA/NifB/PqqE/SkfB family radical SAM enzyme/polysaccharide pyruvyl transferase WcaK-like protein